jgi:hypothetical protein
MENKHLFNRKGLKPFRSSLRNRSTSAEAVLWNMLKSKNLDGKKFRRQYSIGSYIVDFSINHPGRQRSLQFFDYHFGPATPPSKGGETFSNPCI